MSRPSNKEELIQQTNKNFADLLKYISELPDFTIEFAPGTMNRNVRDVLAHLYYWHEMMLDWYNDGMNNKKPIMPTEGYTWKTVPELNQQIWQKSQGIDLNTILSKLNKTHNKLLEIIKLHNNEELFEKKVYKWTGSTSLGSYLVSATSSHYSWALKLIRKATKTVK